MREGKPVFSNGVSSGILVKVSIAAMKYPPPNKITENRIFLITLPYSYVSLKEFRTVTQTGQEP